MAGRSGLRAMPIASSPATAAPARRSVRHSPSGPRWPAARSCRMRACTGSRMPATDSRARRRSSRRRSDS